VNILYPKIRWASLPAMLGYAGLGAVLAGLYGILHDEITYTISPEYFTRLKFYQFDYADFGLPPRVLVAEIGFLATWWVGFFAAWFLARVTVPAFPPRLAFRYTVQGFVIVFLSALTAGIVGFALRAMPGVHYDDTAWADFAAALSISDLPSFVRVAYIHNAGYLGGLLGLVAAIGYVLRQKRIGPPCHRPSEE